MVRLLAAGFPRLYAGKEGETTTNGGMLSAVHMTFGGDEAPPLRTAVLPFTEAVLRPYLDELDAIIISDPSLVPHDCLNIFYDQVVLTGATAKVVASLIETYCDWILAR